MMQEARNDAKPIESRVWVEKVNEAGKTYYFNLIVR